MWMGHNWDLSGCERLAGGNEGRIQGLALPASTPRGEGALPHTAYPVTPTLTCPDQSVASVQQLNFAGMVKSVSINPDPSRVFFMMEATA